MNHKGREYFRFFIGYGTYIPPIPATVKTGVYELEIKYEYNIRVELTFSQRKDVNLLA